MRRGLSSSCVICLFAASASFFLYKRLKKKSNRKKLSCKESGFPALVGNTPLIRLDSLSRATGCTILVKAEFMNPGGSSKDRIAKGILQEALKTGEIKPNGTVVEGTSGSTGISLSLMARAMGYHCVVFMPDDQAKEKTTLLETFGATVRHVKPASIVNSKHYVNQAKQYAASAQDGGERGGRYFVDQFENTCNFNTHLRTTGPEIWAQTYGEIDAFVMSAGTGGTIAGVSQYLKTQKPSVRVYLVDPPGSSLYNKVRTNVCYASEQAETRVKRHRYDTITEGIGLDRLTQNFLAACIDDAYRCSDKEAVEMSRYLLKTEGLFVGSSSAVNCVGAVRAARRLGPGHVIVTMLCDGGHRHLSKFWNDQTLRQSWNIRAEAVGLEFLDGGDGQP